MKSSMITELKDNHKKFFYTHKKQPLKLRIQHLKKLYNVLEEKEQEVYDALFQDLKKPWITIKVKIKSIYSSSNASYNQGDTVTLYLIAWIDSQGNNRNGIQSSSSKYINC